MNGSIKQNQAVGSRVAEAFRHLRRSRKNGVHFHAYWNADVLFYRFNRVDVELFNVSCVYVHVRWNIRNVQLYGVDSRALKLFGVVDPTAFRNAI